MGEDGVLEAALARLDSEAMDVERSLAQALERVETLRKESRRIESARQSLRAVIDPSYEPPTEPPSPWVISTSNFRRIAETGASAVASMEKSDVLGQITIPDFRIGSFEIVTKQQPAEEVVPPVRPKTAEGLLMLLQERTDEDVHINELRDEFRRRDWVPEDSKAPDAMIYAAARRLAREHPNVVRTARRLWRYSLTPETTRDWEAEQQLIRLAEAQRTFGEQSPIENEQEDGAM